MVKNARSANGPVCLSPNLNAVGIAPTCISLLSSSPIQQDETDISTFAEYYGSSPLPVRKKPPGPSFKPGSRAAPIPEGTVTGFQKASSLVQDLEGNWNKSALNSHERKLLPLKSTTRDVDSATSITKAAIEIPTSPHNASAHGVAKDQKLSATDDLLDEDPIKERTSSKPTSALSQSIQHASVGPTAPTAEVEPPESVQSSASAFEELNGNFGYNQQRCSTKSNLAPEGHKGTNPAAEDIEADVDKVKLKNSKVKNTKRASKTAPKKPLTITGRAIANAHRKSPSQESKSDVLVPELAALDFAQLCKVNTDAGNVEKDTLGVMPKIASSKASKKAGKPSAKRMAKPPKLASPSTAIQHMGGQKFLFGTCSQNERDEESNFQIQLERALRASAAGGTTSPDPGAKLRHPILRTIEGSRDLMSQGARGDENFSLLPAEQPRRKRSISNLGCGSVIGEANEIAQSRNNLINEDDKISTTPSAAVEVRTSSLSHPGPRLKLSSAPSLKPRMLASAQSSNSSKTGASTISDIMKNHISTMANSDPTSSTVQKAKKSIATGRGQHSELERNSKTNDSVSTAAGNDNTSQKRIRAKPSKLLGTTQERPLKRKKKGQSQTGLVGGRSDLPPANARTSNNSLEIDDIVDNESPTPSPPRLHPTKTQGQLELSPSRTLQRLIGQSGDEEEQVVMTTEQDEQQELFTIITNTVKATGRSLDPKYPSWHEKILLYDPIILEDFTRWLNTSISATKGNNHKTDIKINTNLVQKWCQKHGVCCVWKKDG